MITLRGMTWDHPRGFDPLVACAAAWEADRGVRIAWDRRSLQDFESFPVQMLAARYDLMVIDHPHMGQVTRERCLVPLDEAGRDGALARLAAEAMGRSFESYRYGGHVWALPIDAATQVQAWRPDLLATPAVTWDDVRTLARAGRVLLPLRPPHALMCLFGLAGNLGQKAFREGDRRLFDPAFAVPAFAHLRDLARSVDPECFGLDPITVYERLSRTDEASCAPLIYGYVSYAHAGFRPARVGFADIPVIGEAGPVGTTLGGTGIAVSARSHHRNEAIAFAFFAADADVQKGLYASSGGQPAHRVAWRDADVNGAAHDFYASTRATVEGAYLRPRHDGYMRFQKEGSALLEAALRGDGDAVEAIARLDRCFADTLGPAHGQAPDASTIDPEGGDAT